MAEAERRPSFGVRSLTGFARRALRSPVPQMAVLTLSHCRAYALALITVPASCAVAFDLEGHRGARGLAPENTLAAFALAIDLGLTTIETDVVITRDDAVVISHNPSLNPDLVRDADGRWLASPGPPIRALSLAELRVYDIGRINPTSAYSRDFALQKPRDGERFPQLADLFTLAKTSGKPVRFNIETKITPTSANTTPAPAEFARRVVDVVRGAGMAERVTIQSFDWRTLREVSRIAPDIPTSCLTIQSTHMDTVKPDASGASPWHGGLVLDASESLPALVKAAGCRTWSMFWRNLGSEQLREAHALGLAVLPWTVNDAADMARLVDMGVDGIITDYPNRLRAVMASKGLALP